MDIAGRVLRRVSSKSNALRIRAGVALLGGSDFERWGRLSDRANPVHIDLDDRWLPRGADQFEFLKSVGLKPSDRFLDYGCSILATARYVIPYLEPGRYVGCDVSHTNLIRGARRLSQVGIDRSTYHTATLRSPDLYDLEGFEFDFVFEYSAFQYMPPRDFKTVLTKIGQMVRPNGTICVGTPVPEHEPDLTRKGMYFHGLASYEMCLPKFNFTVRHMKLGNRQSPMCLFVRGS